MLMLCFLEPLLNNTSKLVTDVVSIMQLRAARSNRLFTNVKATSRMVDSFYCQTASEEKEQKKI